MTYQPPNTDCSPQQCHGAMQSSIQTWDQASQANSRAKRGRPAKKGSSRQDAVVECEGGAQTRSWTGKGRQGSYKVVPHQTTIHIPSKLVAPWQMERACSYWVVIRINCMNISASGHARSCLAVAFLGQGLRVETQRITTLCNRRARPKTKKAAFD